MMVATFSLTSTESCCVLQIRAFKTPLYRNMFLLMIEFLKFKTIQSKINQLLFIIEAPHLTSFHSFHSYSPTKPPLQTTNLIWNWYSKSTSSAQLAGYQTFGGPACCKLTTMVQVHHVTTHSRCATGDLCSNFNQATSENFPFGHSPAKATAKSHAFPAPKGRQNHLGNHWIFQCENVRFGNRVYWSLVIKPSRFRLRTNIFSRFFLLPFSQLKIL